MNLDRLSPQERKVVEGIAAGLPYKAIADGLTPPISVRTVEVYAQRARVKLEAKTVTHLAVIYSLHHRP